MLAFNPLDKKAKNSFSYGSLCSEICLSDLAYN